MQAADSRNLDHVAKRGRLDGSADRCIFLQRQMRAATFVICEIIPQDPSQSTLIEHDNVIQTFASNGPDQALHVGILPRGSRRSQDLLNTHPFCRLTELFTINAVAVSQQVSWGVVPRECFQELSSRPCCSGVRGHSEMNRTSAVIVENHEDE